MDAGGRAFAQSFPAGRWPVCIPAAKPGRRTSLPTARRTIGRPAIRRPGQWWTTALEFCFSYPEPGVGGCFRITKVSTNCYELYDYSSEFGRADAPPLQKGAWNGRMWRTQAPHTCETSPSV